MPPVTLKPRRSFTVRPARSVVIAPAPLTDATLKENAWAETDVPVGRADLNRMRSICRLSVAVPTVEAGVDAHPLLVDDDRRRQPVEHVRRRAAPASA